MCTRANSASVPDSFHALVGSLLTLASAALALAVALVTVPSRAVRSGPTKHGKPASTRHVEVQVHLNDGQRVRAIERACRAALTRAARTWAPFPLPIDRVEVMSLAPPTGKADVFEQWVTAPGVADAEAATLVVVSIGTTFEGRDLKPDEIGGALAAQIERLVIDRYRREHPQGAGPTAIDAERHRQLASVLEPIVASPEPVVLPGNVTEFGSMRAILAEMKKGQPLVPAGPSKNGVHLEPNPAS